MLLSIFYPAKNQENKRENIKNKIQNIRGYTWKKA
jgi:hypothetical protein